MSMGRKTYKIELLNMKIQSNQFIQLADVAIADPQIQSAVEKGTHTADSKRRVVMSETSSEHGEALRQQAASIKRYALNRLPELLQQMEARMQANGIVVLWAADAAEACQHVLDIAKKHKMHRDLLVRLNPGASRRYLKPGERLWVVVTTTRRSRRPPSR